MYSGILLLIQDILVISFEMKLYLKCSRDFVVVLAGGEDTTRGRMDEQNRIFCVVIKNNSNIS